MLAVLALAAAGAAGAQTETLEVRDFVIVNEDDSETVTIGVRMPFSSRPAADRVVSVTVSGSALSVSPTSLTFTRTNWFSAQDLTLTAVSDADNVDPAPVTITLAATGVETKTFIAYVNDDEATLVASAGPPGWNSDTGVAPKASGDIDVYQGFTTGGASGGYLLRSVSLALRSSGTAATTVRLWPGSAGVPDYDATPIDLGTIANPADGAYGWYTVTPSAPVELDANTAYHIQVEGPGYTDPHEEARHLLCTGRTGTLGFAGWSLRDVSLARLANGDEIARCLTTIRVRGEVDGPGLTLSPSTLTVEEGGTGTFDVQLAEAPASTVTVAVASADTGAVSVSRSSLTFTTSTWDTAQTVTVTGVEDADRDDETVAVNLSGTDISNDAVTVTVSDNDGPGYSFTPAALDLEEGSAGMYAVALRAQPSSSVTVGVVSANTGAVSVSPSSLTFATSTWDTAQTVTATAVQDADAIDEAVAVSHTAASSDTDYDDLASVALNVAVDDDEVFSVGFTLERYQVDEDVGNAVLSVAVTDPDGSAASLGQAGVSVILETRERTGVDRRFDALAGSDYTHVRTTLTFGPSDTSAGAMVAIIDDALLEQFQSFDVTLAWAGGTAPRLPDREVALGRATAEVRIASDDRGTLDFDMSSYQVTEGETIDLELSVSAPIEGAYPIGLHIGSTLESDAEFVVTDAATQTLTDAANMVVTAPSATAAFTSTIRVRGLTDAEVESDESGVVSVALPVDRVPTDHLAFGPNLSTGANTDEVTLTVVQSPNAAASGRPSVAGAATVGRELTADKGTVSDGDGLPADDADLEWQWVRQDDAAGTGPADIPSATAKTYTLAAADAGKWVAVKMSYTDGAGHDEERLSSAFGPVGSPGLDVSPNALTVDEGGSGTFDVALSAEPSSSVTVAVTSGDAAAATASPPSLTFATTDWDTVRTVTVTGVEDDVAGDREAVVTFAASGGDYAGVSRTATVTVEDNDVPGLVLAPNRVTVREGEDPATYTVALTVPPSATVTVDVTLSPAAAGSLAPPPASLTFTVTDWDRAQTVTLTSLDDSNLDHEEVTVTHEARGGGYAGVSETVTVTIRDDDLLSWWGSEALPFLVVDEGRPVEWAVRLVSAPSNDLVVTVDSGDDGVLEVSPSALAFTTSDWDSEQTLTFTAAEDADAADATRTATFESGGVTQTRVVHVHDDEATLVSNAAGGPAVAPPTDADTPKAFHGGDERGYQGFTTGAHPEGYTLESLSLALRASGTPPSDVVVRLIPATSGGEPDPDASSARTLGTIAAARQASGRTDLHELRFPAPRLGAGATYFVEISNPGAAGNQVSYFTCAQETDDFGLSGWSLADDSVQDDAGTLRTRGCALMMRMSGRERQRTVLPPGPGPGPAPDPDPDPDPGPPVDTGPLRASFTVEGASCEDGAGGLCRALTGSAVRFVDASTGPAVSWRWSFDDGAQSSLRSPGHSWSTPGFYEVSLVVSGGGRESSASRTFLVEASSPAGSCAAGDLTRCLLDSRFSVAVEWWTADGEAGPGRVVRRGTNDSGLFHFFEPDNWELLVKVLDGCEVNGHVWVFGASATTLGYRIAVTDTVTGAVREYLNEPGMRAGAVTDSTAFADDVCPAPPDDGR